MIIVLVGKELKGVTISVPSVEQPIAEPIPS